MNFGSPRYLLSLYASIFRIWKPTPEARANNVAFRRLNAGAAHSGILNKAPADGPPSMLVERRMSNRHYENQRRAKARAWISPFDAVLPLREMYATRSGCYAALR